VNSTSRRLQRGQTIRRQVTASHNQNQLSQATNAVYVAMSSTITATSDPTYGTISGYALTDSSGNPGTTTTTIVLRPNDVLQFYNAEPAATAPSHSAVGLSTTASPAVPYSFPSADASAIGSVVGSMWSTGVNSISPCNLPEVVAILHKSTLRGRSPS